MENFRVVLDLSMILSVFGLIKIVADTLSSLNSRFNGLERDISRFEGQVQLLDHKIENVSQSQREQTERIQTLVDRMYRTLND